MENWLPVSMNGSSGAVSFTADKDYILRRVFGQGAVGLAMSNTGSATPGAGVFVGQMIYGSSFGATIFQSAELNYPIMKGETIWQMGTGTAFLYLLTV